MVFNFKTCDFGVLDKIHINKIELNPLGPILIGEKNKNRNAKFKKGNRKKLEKEKKVEAEIW